MIHWMALALGVQQAQCPKIGIEGASMAGVPGIMVLSVTATPDPQGVEMILWEVSAGRIVKQEDLSASVSAPSGTVVTAKVELAGMTPETCDPTASLSFKMP